MYLNNCKIEVLVKGRPITEYFHRGQTFIEGREGSEYEVRIVNSNKYRVEAVISVDGLSILNGKEASDQSSGYLVDASSSIVIPGWKVDNATAAHFAFSGKKESYATTMSGSSNNNGVIGAMIFKEKPVIAYQGANFALYNGISTGFPTIGWPIYSNTMNNSIIGASAYSSASASALQSCVNNLSNNISVQSLGTEFGKATEFNTSSVEFNRGDLQAMLVLYYDSRSNLVKRGVPIARSSRQVSPSQPQAFPGASCAIPPGWTG